MSSHLFNLHANICFKGAYICFATAYNFSTVAHEQEIVQGKNLEAVFHVFKHNALPIEGTYAHKNRLFENYQDHLLRQKWWQPLFSATQLLCLDTSGEP